jgi:F-box domain
VADKKCREVDERVSTTYKALYRSIPLSNTYTVTAMRSIPVDVLRDILEHVGKNDLLTLCQVNKICCSCSQDVLYREIQTDRRGVIRTLAHSTDLARRVRSFEYSRFAPALELVTALKSMSLLRTLDLRSWDASILDGCTFKLESLKCFFHGESIRNFLNSQPSLTKLTLWRYREPLPPFEETILPNLTQVTADPSSLHILIPGRPVRSVTVFDTHHAVDYELSFFTLSTAPIQKLTIPSASLFPKPGSLLASLFPSLVHLTLEVYSPDDFEKRQTVRRSLFSLFIYCNK